MDFLEFSDDTISKCGKVLFSYVKTVGKNKLTLYKILKRHGELLEYAVSNGEETFHVFKNGSWDYFSGKMKIAYDSQENIYSLSLTTRSETKLNELSLVKLFPRIKKRNYGFVLMHKKARSKANAFDLAFFVSLSYFLSIVGCLLETQSRQYNFQK